MLTLQTLSRGLSAFLLSCALAVPRPVSAAPPFSVSSLKSAQVLALKTGRVILIDFYTTWCGPCKKLDQITWQNPQVRRWLTRNTISLKMDAEKQTALAKRYKINAYPTLLLLKPNGTEIDRLIGFQEPAEFLMEAKQALAGQDSVARAKAKLTPTGKNDPMQRMQYARALAEKGQTAEALQEFLWCLDEGGKRDSAFSGVRLSFLLGDIVQLGRSYSPALTALKNRRDQAAAELEGKTANYQSVMDFAAYNDTLKETEKTLAAYRQMKTHQSPFTSFLFRHVYNLLLEQQLYADLVEGAGKPKEYVLSQTKEYESLIREVKLEDKAKLYFKQNAIRQCGGLYEALLGTHKTEEAAGVRDQILAFDARLPAFQELMRHARRAGSTAEEEILNEIARRRLSSADFALLEKEPPPR